jgi:glyoxylase-like metal-dependent hydrolase (beta-lactamase superfamily II)
MVGVIGTDSPVQIEIIGISHYHFDHTGQASHFPQAVSSWARKTSKCCKRLEALARTVTLDDLIEQTHRGLNRDASRKALCRRSISA